MIDEKKLIKDIDNCVVGLTNIQIMQIADIIETQPKIGEWIPCSERLPELTEGMEYFKQSPCCLCAVKWWDGEIGEEVGWYNQTEMWNLDSDNRKVIAWMPLPEPYTERKKVE